MPDTHFADRNLLIGILALQNHLIDNDQLVHAMQMWLADKSKPLEQILAEQGSLDSDECTLLTALAARHLSKHDNRPAKSLEALSAVGSSVRRRLQALQDDQVHASLTHVPDAADSLEATGSYQPPLPLGAVRYRVLRKHARGGLGDVFVAMDEELKRDVALKQIQEQYADDPGSRSRFMLEAEVTGRLEHPGIVPVYGLGQYDDGRPFYAMRFIRGDSLREAIDEFHEHDRRDDWSRTGERTLRLRKLLGRFLDVCDAIEYAHSRGVLHRDLKPGNVMLGKHGETLVVDWGLAKLVALNDKLASVEQEPPLETAHPDDSRTQAGSTVGTPAYMSPEQAAGRLDLLDCRSDVYSLGATLFSLLTGAAPVTGDSPEEIQRKVEKGRISQPREVNSRVPRALEAICLKSMALAPDQRYATPRALAEDIEHWLADEPVSAYSDPLLMRAARWSRRHKVTVAAVLVLLVTGLVSVSIGAAMLSAANRRILAAQQQAEANEQVANENYQLARDAVEDYLTKVSQEILLDQPGMQPLRKELLGEALEYYRQFVQRRSDDQNAQADLAAAHLRMGAIVERIGSRQDAVSAYRQALKISEALLQEDPGDASRIFNLALARTALAISYHDLGRYDEALAEHAGIASLVEPLMDHPEFGPQARLELAQVYNQQGAIQREQGQRSQALDLYRRAESMLRALPGEFENPADVQDVLARSLYNQGIVFREVGEFQKSLELFQQAMKIREQMAVEHPEVQGNHSKLALCFGGMANSLGDLGRHQEALQLRQRVIEIRERLARENPAVTDYLEQLAAAKVSLATTEKRLGNLSRAEALGEQATALLQRLTEQYPEVVDFRGLLALNYYNLGNVFLGDPVAQLNTTDESVLQEQCRLAVEQYLQGITVYESLADEFPDVPDFRAGLARVCNNCGSAYHLLEENEKSQEMESRSMALREQLVADFPEVPDYRNELASSLFNSAGDQKDLTLKLDLISRSVDLRRSLADDFPDVPDYRAKLAFALQGLSMNQFMGGQPAEALSNFDQCISIYEQLHTEFPNVEGYRRNLLQSLDVQATIMRLANQLPRAEAALQRVVELQRQWLDNNPEDTAAMIGLARAFEGIGKCHHKAKDYATACDYYDQGLDVLRPSAEAPGSLPIFTATMQGIRELKVVALETSGRFVSAVETAERIAATADNPQHWQILAARLQALAGNHSEAVARARSVLADRANHDAGDSYNLACVFALAAAATTQDERLTAEDRDQLQVDFLAQSLACLQNAQANGYFKTADEIEGFRRDTDFSFFRQSPEFQEFDSKLKPPQP